MEDSQLFLVQNIWYSLYSVYCEYFYWIN